LVSWQSEENVSLMDSTRSDRLDRLDWADNYNSDRYATGHCKKYQHSNAS